MLAANAAGSLTLTGGQSAVAEQGRAPALRAVVRPRDAVQWALYYPPIIYFRPDEFPAGPGWQGMVRNSIESYTRGDLQAAFESIKGVPDTLGDPRFFAYRASLLLAVGRVDEASTRHRAGAEFKSERTAMPWRCNRLSPWCKTTKRKRSIWHKRPSRRIQTPPRH